MTKDEILEVFQIYNIDYIADSVYVDNDGNEIENTSLINKVFEYIHEKTNVKYCFLNSIYFDYDENQIIVLWENEEEGIFQRVYIK